MLRNLMIFPLLRSLCITGLAGVLAPTFFIGSILLIVFALGYIPGLGELSNASKSYILSFLKVFGSGHPMQGIGILAAVSGAVAMLFDTYNLLASSKPVR